MLENPNLTDFHNALLKTNPKLIVINSHGGSKGLEISNHVILGVVDYDPELDKKIYRQNPETCAGRLVFLATCNAGKELAFRLVDYGAIAVAAFRDAFIFLSEEHVPPDRDESAKPFFISLLQLPLHLSDGKNFGFAANATRKAFRYYMKKAEAENRTEQAKFLNWNLTNFVAIGDLSASL